MYWIPADVKNAVIHCVLRLTTLILGAVRTKGPSSARNILLHGFIEKKKATKVTINYGGISLLSTTHNLTEHHLLRSTPQTKRRTSCGFRPKRSTTNHIYCTWHALVKNCSTYDFKKAYDSVMREVWLLKMSRNEADNKFRMWEFSPDTVPIRSGLKVGEVL